MLRRHQQQRTRLQHPAFLCVQPVSRAKAHAAREHRLNDDVRMRVCRDLIVWRQFHTLDDHRARFGRIARQDHVLGTFREGGSVPPRDGVRIDYGRFHDFLCRC